MLRFALLALLAALLALPAQAQTRRALLIGINEYAPDGATAADRGSQAAAEAARTWTNLEGAVNDAEAMAALLQARYDFPAENVRVLRNSEATRDGILQAVETHLVEPAQPGDVLVFYYAGHGSQVRNTADTEGDGYDETLVPADANEGVPDLRDKELRDLFNAVLDQTGEQARVVLIFDSCHSGSITRGVTAGLTRQIEPAAAEVFDDSDLQAGVERPEERGALVISAAREEQLAREVRDADGIPHGALTWALLQILQDLPPDQSAREVFARARALMRSAPQVTQEPVLAGTPDARNQPLFGGTARQGGTRVAVLEAGSGGVVLQGGLALGLRPGTELTAGETVLRVTEADGLTRARAEVVSGAAPGVGDLFEVTAWVASPGEALRLYLPPSGGDYATVLATARALTDPPGLSIVPSVNLVRDPTADGPDHVLTWDGAAWQLRRPGGETARLGAEPEVASIVTALRPRPGDLAHVWPIIPPFDALRAALLDRVTTDGRPVEFVDTLDEADYVLAGRPAEGGIEYAWVLLGATVPGNTPAEPPRSDWQTLNPDRMLLAGRLARYVDTLHRVWGWMNLRSAPETGAFPYRVAGFEPEGGGPLRTALDTLRAGERFRLVLQADPAALEEASIELMDNPDLTSRRFVYFFAIDKTGTGVLLYPRGNAGNTANAVDFVEDGLEVALPRAEGASMFVIQPPFGVDSFFLLTSEEAITDPEGVFNFSGVATRGRAPTDPLGSLLHGLGTGTRGVGTGAVPTNWSIERITVVSADR